jgi:LysM repeat protein
MIRNTMIRTTMIRIAPEDAMSAAVARELVPAPGCMPSRTARPRLRLVGPGERIHTPARSAIRLTRRGRLLISLVGMVALLALAVVLANSVSAAAPQIDHAITVSAGQTLSELAAAQLPSLRINEAVARIQLANGLNTSQVHAGQLLLIPAIP